MHLFRTLRNEDFDVNKDDDDELGERRVLLPRLANPSERVAVNLHLSTNFYEVATVERIPSNKSTQASDLDIGWLLAMIIMIKLSSS